MNSNFSLSHYAHPKLSFCRGQCTPIIVCNTIVQGDDNDDVDSGDVEGDGGNNSANLSTHPSSPPSTSAAYASPRHNCMQEVAP